MTLDKTSTKTEQNSKATMNWSFAVPLSGPASALAGITIGADV